MKQRVSVARAMVHQPDVVLADEPFTGLDVVGSKALSQLLNDLKTRGAALVLVTHNVVEGLSLATHAAIMNRGRMVRHEARGAIDPVTFAREYEQLVAANA